MGLFQGVVNVVSSVCSGISNVCGKIGKGIGEFAKNVFIPALFPPLGGLETAIKIIGGIIGVIAEALGLKKPEEKPEEIGIKAEEAANNGIKPENFDSYSEYISYLRENIKVDKEKIDNLSDEERLKYTAVGSSILVKGIEEKEKIEIPAEFVLEIAKQKLQAEEVREYMKNFKESGLQLSDFTKYLKGTLDSNAYEKVGKTIENAIKTLNPQMSDQDIDNKIEDMSQKSKE